MALRVMSMAEIRLEVLLEAARSGETVTEVRRRHGTDRKAFYRYLRRYQAETGVRLRTAGAQRSATNRPTEAGVLDALPGAVEQTRHTATRTTFHVSAP